MIRRYPARPGCFTWSWSWTVACVLLGGCTLRGDGIPTPAWRDAGQGKPAPAADLDPQALAAAAPSIDLAGAFIFPDRPTAWEHLLWPRLVGAKVRLTPEAGVDAGLLRQRPDGAWELYRGGGWTAFDPSHVGHVGEARKYYRYSPGWSAGPACHNRHDDPKGEWQEVNGRAPDPMTAEDLDYDCSLYARTRAAWCTKVLGAPCPETSPAASAVRVTPEVLAIAAPSPGRYTVRVEVAPAGFNTAWNVRVTTTALPAGVLLTAYLEGEPGRIGRRGAGAVEVAVLVRDGTAPGRYGAGLRLNHSGGPTLVPVSVLVGPQEPETPPPPPPEPPPPPPPPLAECPPPPVCRCEAQVSRAPGDVPGSLTLCVPAQEPPR